MSDVLKLFWEKIISEKKIKKIEKIILIFETEKKILEKKISRKKIFILFFIFRKMKT